MAPWTDRSSLVGVGKQVNVKQESATFYDSGPAHPISSRMSRAPASELATVTQEGYNTSAINFLMVPAGVSELLAHGCAIRGL